MGERLSASQVFVYPTGLEGTQVRQRLAVQGPPALYVIDSNRDVLADDLGAMVDRSLASGFGPHKETTLPRQCRECEVKRASWGDCPKRRFAVTADGEPGLHDLCAGYKKFFRHIRKYLRAMTTSIANDLPVAMVMQAIDGR